MVQLLAKPIAHFALHLGQKQLKGYFSKKIDEQIITQAQSRIESEISTAINNVGKRTQFYFYATAVNLVILFLILYLQNKWITAGSVLISFLFLCFYIRSNITAFLNSIAYIENFEAHIKSYVQEGLAQAKNQDWKK